MYAYEVILSGAQARYDIPIEQRRMIHVPCQPAAQTIPNSLTLRHSWTTATIGVTLETRLCDCQFSVCATDLSEHDTVSCMSLLFDEL